MIDSFVFYLVRGVEVATIKSVWKKFHQLLLSSLVFEFEAKFCYILGFYVQIHWHIQIPRKKTLLMKPLTFTIMLIKCEKILIEVKILVSEFFFFLKLNFMVFNCTNFTINILIKTNSTRTWLGCPAFQPCITRYDCRG